MLLPPVRHRALPPLRLLAGNTPRHHLGTRTVAHNSSTWSHLAASKQITLHKSIFQGYASFITHLLVESPRGGDLSPFMKNKVIPSLLTHLHDVEPWTRRATHVMYAWKVRADWGNPSSSAYIGSSDGGETGAGERLQRLLQHLVFDDIILVVIRRHGGTQLGPDRWKCISTVAKDALQAGGFRDGGAGEAAGSDRDTGATTANKKRRR